MLKPKRLLHQVLVYLVVIIATSNIITLVLGKYYSFSTCDGMTDEMNVITINITPNTLTCDDTAIVTVNAQPSVTVFDGAYINLRILYGGFSIVTTQFDLCDSLVGAICPIVPTEYVTIQLEQPLSFSSCRAVSGLKAEVQTYNYGGTYESCIDLTFDISLSERAKKAVIMIVIIVVCVVGGVCLLSCVIGYIRGWYCCSSRMGNSVKIYTSKVPANET
jgi:hypothetical protein